MQLNQSRLDVERPEAGSFCAKALSFAAYRSPSDMRAAHFAPCAKIYCAAASFSTAWIRLSNAYLIFPRGMFIRVHWRPQVRKGWPPDGGHPNHPEELPTPWLV